MLHESTPCIGVNRGHSCSPAFGCAIASYPCVVGRIEVPLRVDACVRQPVGRGQRKAPKGELPVDAGHGRGDTRRNERRNAAIPLPSSPFGAPSVSLRVIKPPEAQTDEAESITSPAHVKRLAQKRLRPLAGAHVSIRQNCLAWNGELATGG